MERSFAEEVKQLALGEGQVLRGEGILAITKALLQAGVSYVGGYPGAPVSHLLDVLADANESLLKPMGVYLDASANEAAAAALLAASITYPMPGAVTWKSIVGPNVAQDPPPRAPLLRLRPPEPPAVDLHPGGPEVRAPAARGAALYRRARAQRGAARGGEGARHHPAGRAHPDRAAGARIAGRGRRLRAEPHPGAGAERDPPARAGSAPGLARGQAAGAGAGRTHADLHP